MSDSVPAPGDLPGAGHFSERNLITKEYVDFVNIYKMSFFLKTIFEAEGVGCDFTLNQGAKIRCRQLCECDLPGEDPMVREYTKTA